MENEMIDRTQSERVAHAGATCLLALEDDPKASNGAALMLMMLAPVIAESGRLDERKFLAMAGVNQDGTMTPHQALIAYEMGENVNVTQNPKKRTRKEATWVCCWPGGAETKITKIDTGAWATTVHVDGQDDPLHIEDTSRKKVSVEAMKFGATIEKRKEAT